MSGGGGAAPMSFSGSQQIGSTTLSGSGDTLGNGKLSADGPMGHIEAERGADGSFATKGVFEGPDGLRVGGERNKDGSWGVSAEGSPLGKGPLEGLGGSVGQDKDGSWKGTAGNKDGHLQMHKLEDFISQVGDAAEHPSLDKLKGFKDKLPIGGATRYGG